MIQRIIIISSKHLFTSKGQNPILGSKNQYNFSLFSSHHTNERGKPKQIKFFFIPNNDANVDIKIS